MKRYFIVDGYRRLGPYDIDELKNLNITPDTVIWTFEENEKKASEYADLAAVWDKSTTIIPNNNEKPKLTDKELLEKYESIKKQQTYEQPDYEKPKIPDQKLNNENIEIKQLPLADKPDYEKPKDSEIISENLMIIQNEQNSMTDDDLKRSSQLLTAKYKEYKKQLHFENNQKKGLPQNYESNLKSAEQLLHEYNELKQQTILEVGNKLNEKDILSFINENDKTKVNDISDLKIDKVNVNIIENEAKNEDLYENNDKKVTEFQISNTVTQQTQYSSQSNNYNYNIGNKQPSQTDTSQKTYLILSVITTLLCCLPLGLIGISYSSKAKTAFQQGNTATGKQYATTSLSINIFSIIIGIIFWIIVVSVKK